MRTVLYTFCAGMLLASCGASESRNAAEAKANAVYRELAGGVGNSLLDLYSPTFYEYVTREDWAEMLRNINATLGEYRHHELVNWNIHTGRTELGTGTRVTLVYRVVYSKHEATEQLDFFGKDAQLVGHRIDSPHLLVGE